MAIQTVVIMACGWKLTRLMTVGNLPLLSPVFLTEGMPARWHADPITEAITRLQVANNTIEDLQREIETLKAEAVRRHELVGRYVTKEEFGPVRSVVFGMVAFIVLSFLASTGAVIAWKTAK
jgi:hypothetical protein